jgi:hypothetical protein
VERGEGDAGLDPADVHDHRRLVADALGVAAERRAWLSEEDRAEGVEAFERVEGAVVGAVAVGPLVVARRVDDRVFEALERLRDRREALVGARRAAVFYVADVGGDPDFGIVVDGVDELTESGFLVGALGNVADDRDREALSGLAGRIAAARGYGPRRRHR